MNILISYDHREKDLIDLPIYELAAFALSYVGAPAHTEVSISFVDDDTIAELNERYRGKVGPTDVLSFECDGVTNEFDETGAMAATGTADVEAGQYCEDGEGEVYELGDVVIAPDVAERQTKEFGTTFVDEISLLLVHSILHLRGYDHIEDDEAAIMEALEKEILSAWAESRK